MSINELQDEVIAEFSDFDDARAGYGFKRMMWMVKSFLKQKAML